MQRTTLSRTTHGISISTYNINEEEEYEVEEV